ncbi:MAG: cation diffusion facilitator family transporter [Thermodesulfobacteriota bacterium]
MEDHVDITTGGPGEAEREIRRVTWWGFFGNIALSVFKIIAGIFGHSQSLVADGIHSVTDTVTDLAVIVGSYIWSKPADQSHPYGHKRLETTVSIFIGVFLFAAGIGIGWKSLASIDDRHIHHPTMIALIAAVVSIFTKEGLFQWTRLVGKRVNSVSLTANAWHHRIDAFSSIPVVVAVAAAIVNPAWHILDHAAAFLVAGLVCYAASRIVLSGFKELVDQGAPREVCEEIREIAMTNPKVRQVHDIRTRYTGNRLHVDLHVVVDSGLTVYAAHQVAGDCKARILEKGPNVVDVVVHIEPMESARSNVPCR